MRSDYVDNMIRCAILHEKLRPGVKSSQNAFLTYSLLVMNSVDRGELLPYSLII